MKNRKLILHGPFNLFRVLKTILTVVLVYGIAETIFSCECEYQSNLKKKPNMDIVHNVIVNKYFEQRKGFVTTKLGSALFKNKPLVVTQQLKKFVIFIWKYWSWLKERHVGNHTGKNPLDNCSVKNCIFTDNDLKIKTADVVLVHIQHGLYPKVKKRKPKQIWVFLTDESPHSTFSMAHPNSKPALAELANIFNWSMTYRSDSDVPVPYGRTVPLPKASVKDISAKIPYWNKKDKKVLIAGLIFNCGVTKRMNYINELQRFIKIHLYGNCSQEKSRKNSCPGSYRKDCPLINVYYFYLAFENAECRHYFTEKIFYNAYTKGAIPIIMGPPKSDCEKLLPPQSYIHVDNFATPKKLAAEIVNISKNRVKLLTFHKWRQHFKVVNEHGYFGTKSYHLCRLCETLNLNHTAVRKSYSEEDLKRFLDPNLLCRDL